MNLKEMRLSKGLKQSDLLEVVRMVDPRIDKSLLSKIENGVVLPTPEVESAILSWLQPLQNPFESVEGKTVSPNTKVAEKPNMEAEMIVNLIPHGWENAITRRELVQLTGLTDREIRRRIHDARDLGYIIINNQDGCGYYTTDDPRVIQRQYHQERKRFVMDLKTLKTMRHILIENGIEVK